MQQRRRNEFRKNIIEKLDIENWGSWYYNPLLFLSSSKDDYEIPEIVKKLVEEYGIRTVEEEEE